MATCPRDGATIEVDYGMATCPQCGVVLFIDMDGEAQLGAEAEVIEEPPPLVEDVVAGAAEEASPEEAPPVEAQDFTFDVAGEEPPLDSSPELAPQTSAKDPLGLQSYVNSEISQAKDGAYLFRIFISGIDTKEIRESLREAITDNRFGWDVSAIMSSIVKGELRIENVSPVKASIVVNRIKRLPVRIRWEQYAVSQAELS